MSAKLPAFALVLLAAGQVHAAGTDRAAADPVRAYRGVLLKYPARAEKRNAKRALIQDVAGSIKSLSEPTCRGWLCTMAMATGLGEVLKNDDARERTNAAAPLQRELDAEHATATAAHAQELEVHARALGEHGKETARYEQALALHDSYVADHEKGVSDLARWKVDDAEYTAKLQAAGTSKLPWVRKKQIEEARAVLGPRPTRPTVPPAPGAAPTAPGAAPVAPGAPVRRLAGLTPHQEATLTTRRGNVQYQLANYTRTAQHLDVKAAELGLRGRVGALYGRSAPDTGDAIDALHAEIAALEASPDEHAPERTLAAATAKLQRAISTKIRTERPAFQARLKSADTGELFEEALELINDVQELTTGTKIRAEVVTEAGGSSSSSHYSSSDEVEMAAGRGAAYGRRASSSAGGKSRSQWSSRTKQLILDAEELRLDVGEPSPYDEDLPAVTPPEARLVLEKVVRAQAIYRALVKRDPDRASAMHAWMQHTQIHLNFRDSRHGTAQRTLQVRRLAPDLLETEDLGIIDAARARDLRELADQSISKF